MKLLLDEMDGERVAKLLDERGHDAVHVRAIGLGGAPDADVLTRAVDDGRTLVTENASDFLPLLDRRQGAPAYRRYRAHSPVRCASRSSLPCHAGPADTCRMTVRGSTAYEHVQDLPPRVQAAVAIASAQEFDHSCAPEQGRLLSVLARGYVGLRVGETGTGCGVGLAWMLHATDATTSFVSIEIDAARAEASAELFADLPNVRVLNGDWTELHAFGPFDLLVLDGGGKGKEPGDDPPLDPSDGWLAVGGTIVLDDFTPGDRAHDEARCYWLDHPCLQATELVLTPTLSTVVARRIR